MSQPETLQQFYNSRGLRKPTRLTYSSSFKGRKVSNQDTTDGHFSRDDSLRHSTGSIKGGKKMERVLSSPGTNLGKNLNSHNEKENVEAPPTSPSVHHLIKGFQSKIVNNSDALDITDYGTPGYVAESPATGQHRRTNSKRKLSLRNNNKKQGKMSTDDARYSILQSLGVSPFAGNENRGIEKSYGYLDIQSLFFDLQNASTLKSTFDEGSSYTKKLSGASAAFVKGNQTRRKSRSGDVDRAGKVESMIDEGDSKENELLLGCPYFRNEIAEEEDNSSSGDASHKQTKDIAKLISMFNRNRSFENLRNDNYDVNKPYSKNRRQLDSTEQHIFLEEIKEGSNFFAWDEPNVNGKQIFDFEHIDRGALYYREYFYGKDHYNLFGIDEKYGPIGISIIREVLPRMAVLGHNNDANEKQNKKYQYRIIVRTCELYALRISVLENSIPSTSRHGSNRLLPFKDILEFCFPEVQFSCLKHCLPIPKIGEQLLKLDEQQLSLNYKIGLLYCKAGQKTEEEMYNNENGGSEFLEFCSVIADKVALRGFTGYRAQLDNKNDSTGQHSLYTNFHGREVMFHVSTELPYTAHDRQQLLRKRHIGNDIVTVIFQEEGAEPFTPKIMRSHFQHVFVVVRVEKPHTEDTRYSIAVSRSRDVPYFGPPIPPNKFYKNAAFREFLLSKLINAENAAHKSDKFTHMARRTRYEYLKDLAMNQVSQQALETSNKFAFSFGAKKKEKTHPPVSPEIWLQGGLVWSVKCNFEHEGPGSTAFLSISTKCITFVEQSTQEVLLAIPCKSVLGWRPTSHTLKIFYDVGKLAYFTMADEDFNELPYVMHRLKAVTTGCETQDLALKRNNDGQLGFHVFYEGLVAEVEPYGLAWQGGLRKGSRLLEISGHAVGNMSHERMILMLKRPGAVRIVVLPPAPDGQPRNYKAVRNMRRYSSMTSVYSMSTTNCNIGDHDEGMSSGSSKEYLTGSTESPNETTTTNNDSTPTSNRAPKMRSLSHDEALLQREESQSTASGDNELPSTIPPQRINTTNKENQRSHYSKISQERLLTSRSASDVMGMSLQSSPSKSQTPSSKMLGVTMSPTAVRDHPHLSPEHSFDHELGELERQLTNTRKSIDAKFYKSLANSSSPFFRPSKPPGLMSPVEAISGGNQAENEFIPIDRRSIDSGDDSSTNVMRNSAAYIQRISSDSDKLSAQLSSNEGVEKPSTKKLFEPLRYHDDEPVTKPTATPITQNVTKRKESLEIEINKQTESTAFITPASPVKPPRQVLKNAQPITFKIDAKGGMVKKLEKSSSDEKLIQKESQGKEHDHLENFSDHAIDRVKSGSRETLLSDNEISRRGNLVTTMVRDAAEIINERGKGRDSPVTIRLDGKGADSPVNARRSDVKMRKSVDHTIFIKDPHSEHSKLTQRYSHGSRLPPSSSQSMDAEEKRLSTQPNKSPKLNARENILKVLNTAPRGSSSKTGKSPTHSLKDMQRSSGARQGVILDDSLTDTFAKLDAAFAFKPSPSPDGSQKDEKRRRRRNKRRSRNYEPPASDSDSNDSSPNSRRRGGGIRIQLKKNDDPETASLNSKSEAEQSLEAAITDFHISLSSMPERTHKRANSTPFYHQYSSDNNDPTNPPKIPTRLSRPSGSKSYVREQRSKSQDYTVHYPKRPLSDYSATSSKSDRSENVDSSSSSSLKRRSEAKISMTTLRPWSPPIRRVEPSANILQHVKERSSSQKQRDKLKVLTINTKAKTSHPPQSEVIEYEERITTESIAVEDQLSPLPDVPPRPPSRGTSRYTNSLPGRSNKRRRAAAQKTESGLRSKSTSCIPLAVRGLDLAATDSTLCGGPSTKEDLKVMIAVMEEELEQEREEKQKLVEELNRSKEEKERILEQSKQAASQLRKFTALFLDASPKEIEKAKQKYNEAR